MNKSADTNGSLTWRLIITTLGFTLMTGCLEEVEQPPLPPLAEDLRYDGSMYEPPSSPNGDGSGSGYGYGSSGVSPYGTPEAEEE